MNPSAGSMNVYHRLPSTGSNAMPRPFTDPAGTQLEMGPLSAPMSYSSILLALAAASYPQALVPGAPWVASVSAREPKRAAPPTTNASSSMRHGRTFANTRAGAAKFRRRTYFIAAPPSNLLLTVFPLPAGDAPAGGRKMQRYDDQRTLPQPRQIRPLEPPPPCVPRARRQRQH